MCVCVACCLAGCDVENHHLQPDENTGFQTLASISHLIPSDDELGLPSDFFERTTDGETNNRSATNCDCEIEVTNVEYSNTAEDNYYWIFNSYSVNGSQKNCPGGCSNFFDLRGDGNECFGTSGTCTHVSPEEGGSVTNTNQMFNCAIPQSAWGYFLEFRGMATSGSCGFANLGNNQSVTIDYTITCTNSDGNECGVPSTTVHSKNRTITLNSPANDQYNPAVRTLERFSFDGCGCNPVFPSFGM